MKSNIENSKEEKIFSYKVIMCPCCGSKTLDNFYICRFCRWEYDGIRDKNRYSSCNSSSILNYRKTNNIKFNFLRFFF